MKTADSIALLRESKTRKIYLLVSKNLLKLINLRKAELILSKKFELNFSPSDIN